MKKFSDIFDESFSMGCKNQTVLQRTNGIYILSEKSTPKLGILSNIQQDFLLLLKMIKAYSCLDGRQWCHPFSVGCRYQLHFVQNLFVLCVL
jgi:hypothetical protein